MYSIPNHEKYTWSFDLGSHSITLTQTNSGSIAVCSKSSSDYPSVFFLALTRSLENKLILIGETIFTTTITNDDKTEIKSVTINDQNKNPYSFMLVVKPMLLELLENYPTDPLLLLSLGIAYTQLVELSEAQNAFLLSARYYSDRIKNQSSAEIYRNTEALEILYDRCSAHAQVTREKKQFAIAIEFYSHASKFADILGLLKNPLLYIDFSLTCLDLARENQSQNNNDTYLNYAFINYNKARNIIDKWRNHIFPPEDFKILQCALLSIASLEQKLTQCNSATIYAVKEQQKQTRRDGHQNIKPKYENTEEPNRVEIIAILTKDHKNILILLATVLNDLATIENSLDQLKQLKHQLNPIKENIRTIEKDLSAINFNEQLLPSKTIEELNRIRNNFDLILGRLSSERSKIACISLVSEETAQKQTKNDKQPHHKKQGTHNPSGKQKQDRGKDKRTKHKPKPNKIISLQSQTQIAPESKAATLTSIKKSNSENQQVTIIEESKSEASSSKPIQVISVTEPKIQTTIAPAEAPILTKKETPQSIETEMVNREHAVKSKKYNARNAGAVINSSQQAGMTAMPRVTKDNTTPILPAGNLDKKNKNSTGPANTAQTKILPDKKIESSKNSNDCSAKTTISPGMPINSAHIKAALSTETAKTPSEQMQKPRGWETRLAINTTTPSAKDSRPKKTATLPNQQKPAITKPSPTQNQFSNHEIQEIISKNQDHLPNDFFETIKKLLEITNMFNCKLVFTGSGARNIIFHCSNSETPLTKISDLDFKIIITENHNAVLPKITKDLTEASLVKNIKLSSNSMMVFSPRTFKDPNDLSSIPIDITVVNQTEINETDGQHCFLIDTIGLNIEQIGKFNTAFNLDKKSLLNPVYCSHKDGKIQPSTLENILTNNPKALTRLIRLAFLHKLSITEEILSFFKENGAKILTAISSTRDIYAAEMRKLLLRGHAFELSTTEPYNKLFFAIMSEKFPHLSNMLTDDSNQYHQFIRWELQNIDNNPEHYKPEDILEGLFKIDILCTQKSLPYQCDYPGTLSARYYQFCNGNGQPYRSTATPNRQNVSPSSTKDSFYVRKQGPKAFAITDKPEVQKTRMLQ